MERAFAALVAVAVFAAFWGRALVRLGAPPAPLDDVFIHFGFARSLAFGHPMEWIAGNGYSSGATSLLYPVLLAPFVRLGFSGERLGFAAALLGVVFVADALHSAFAVAPRGPAWLRFAAPLLLVAVPLVDWSLCSGMETALFAAVLGRALLAVRRAARSPSDRRSALQLRAGVWFALLIATRPESIVLALALALAVAWAAGSLSTPGSLGRAAAPTLLLLAAEAATNFAFTGEAAAAGAVRKLVTSNPYAAPSEIAIEIVKNAAALREQVGFALGPGSTSVAIALLVAAALLDRATRFLAAPLVAGALGALALVCLNATARYQNLRYAVPSILMIALASTLGARALARRHGLARWASLALVAVALIAPSSAFARQIDHFLRASTNVRDQQIEVGRRLAVMTPPAPRRIFVNDAGAIPYVSELPAIDGLGLGGFRGLPFARASVHGVPAVIELVKRLEPRDRPDVLAVYPGWWPGLVEPFGRRVGSVRIDDNVICGADEKVVYAADWSALPTGDEGAPPGVVDELDVADLVDERAHRYAFGAPHSGYAIGAVLRGDSGRAFWDGGRIVSEGSFERFDVREGVPPGPATLVLRTDGGAAFELAVVASRPGRRDLVRRIRVGERAPGLWSRVDVGLDDVASSDVISLHAVHGAVRDFHLWITRP